MKYIARKLVVFASILAVAPALLLAGGAGSTLANPTAASAKTVTIQNTAAKSPAKKAAVVKKTVAKKTAAKSSKKAVKAAIKTSVKKQDITFKVTAKGVKAADINGKITITAKKPRVSQTVKITKGKGKVTLKAQAKIKFTFKFTPDANSKKKVKTTSVNKTLTVKAVDVPTEWMGP
jgi:hypothetical protein